MLLLKTLRFTKVEKNRETSERSTNVRSIERVKNKREMAETTCSTAFPCVFSFLFSFFLSHRFVDLTTSNGLMLVAILTHARYAYLVDNFEDLVDGIIVEANCNGNS